MAKGKPGQLGKKASFSRPASVDTVWFSGAPRLDKADVFSVVGGKGRVFYAYPKGKKRLDKNMAIGFLIPTRHFASLVKKGEFRYSSPRELIDDMTYRIFRLVPEHGFPANRETPISKSAELAFEKGIGECFQKASIIVAIARANGFKARIVGGKNARKASLVEKAIMRRIIKENGFIRDIFSPGAHYWAEVFNGSFWEEIDTVYPNQSFDRKKIRQKHVLAHEELEVGPDEK